MGDPARIFYDREYLDDEYASPMKEGKHAFRDVVKGFVESHGLQDKRCLEIGCGRGVFQDLVGDYTGIDISRSVGRFMHKPFLQASATELPFPENSFDAIWTITVLEHVPHPERGLEEMHRVLKPGGLLLLAPAWQCRPWAADGYPVRPYDDFNLKGKLIKASIPLRNSVAFRASYIFPMRLARLMQYLVTKRPMNFAYRKLKPNYEKYWMSDSDAVNSMDPYEAILWFVSRGGECLNYPGGIQHLGVRNGALVFRIDK